MKRKKEKSDNIWDKIINALWFLLLGFILMMCVFIFLSTTGHCATTSSMFPYYFYSEQKSDIPDIYINQFISDCHLDNDVEYIVFPIDTNYTSIFFLLIKDPVFNMPNNINEYDFTNSFYNVYSLSNTFYWGLYRFDNGYHGAQLETAYPYYQFGGNPNSSMTFHYTFYPHYPCAISSNGIVYNRFTLNTPSETSSNIAIYTDESQIAPDISYGHATPPEEFHNPFFNPNSHAQPPEEVPPQVTINNYTWNTYNPPAIDDTDIISTLKSLIYVVNYLMGWLKDNISGEFQNLLSNLKGFFDYIGQTIQYYGGLIIDNIQNLITTFYNNMVSLVEDIAEKVGYISEPFDSIALTNAFESMQIYDDYDRCGQLIDDAFGFFDDISEPTFFIIPIDLRGITLLHQTQILYFDLGWINSAKSVIRAFMWTVTTFGLLYTVIDSIPDYLQGQDE